MNFIVILLCTATVACALDAITCPTYSCSPPAGMVWPAGVCGQMNSGGTEYYFNSTACSKEETCSFSQNQPALSTCEKVSPDSPQSCAYPGEPCDDYHSCVSGSCESKRCVPPTACSNYFDCAPGSYCQNALCTPQAKAGDPCTHDYQCQNNSTCDNSQDGQPGKCVPYLSALPGTQVATCHNSAGMISFTFGVNNICQSDKCVSLGGTVFKCSEPVTSNQTVYPLQCSPGKSCVSQKDSVSGLPQDLQCACGYSTNGVSYCPLFVGDPEAQTLVSMWLEWLNSEEIQHCNTYNRPETNYWAWCMQSTYKKYYQLTFQMQKVMNYQYIAGADNCYLQYIYPQYFEAMEHLSLSATLSLAAALLWALAS